jgi:hypothetical protein
MPLSEATRCEEDRDSIPGNFSDWSFLVSLAAKPALGPNQPPAQ